MTHPISVVLVGLAVLTALPAEARFGKKSAQQPQSKSTHESEPVGSTESSSNSGGSYAPGSGSYYSGRGRYGGRGYRRYSGGYSRYGFWSGAFVPSYGFIYAAPRSRVVLTPAEPEVQEELEPEQEPESPGIRVSVGVEGQGYRNGFTAGALIGVEGDRWGFSGSGQNIAVLAEDGTGRLDHLQVATAHLTYAFVTGRYGRLRVEGGADAVFAPDLIVVGPTAGFSGTVWVGGPFAIEGSVMLTPWPYRQFDGKLGAALGLGPFGIRAGMRAQVLDDRGLVDGVIHTDSFIGPYVGLSLVF
jgi:hypothetical protein